MWVLILAISLVLIFLTKEHIDLRDTITKSNRELYQKQKDVDVLDRKIQELEPKLQKAEEQLSELESDHQTKDRTHLINQGKLNEDIADMKKKINAREAQLKELQDEKAELSTEQKKYDKIVADQASIIAGIRLNKEIGDKTPIALQAEIEAMAAENDQMEKENAKLQKDVDENEKTYFQQKEKYDKYMSVEAITDLKLIYAKDIKSAKQQAAGAGADYKLIEPSINDGSKMKVKGYLAYRMGKRSDAGGYITDILALSHPHYFNRYKKDYGAWQRVLTLNNGGPDNLKD